MIQKLITFNCFNVLICINSLFIDLTVLFLRCSVIIKDTLQISQIQSWHLASVLDSGNRILGLPHNSVGKESACNAGDKGEVGSIPGSGRSPGRGHGNPLQYSCLKKIPWTEESGRLQPTPGGSKSLQCRRLTFSPWVGKIPWRREWQPILVVLPGDFHGQRSLMSCNPWGHKESDMAEQGTHNRIFEVIYTWKVRIYFEIKQCKTQKNLCKKKFLCKTQIWDI